MTREEFIKQRCEIDKITEEEFEKQYRVIKCDCGQPYCKGYRCLDLDGLLKEIQESKEKLNKYENPEDMTLMMMWCTEKVKDENKKLKQQLEDKEDYIKKLQATKDKLDKWDYENTLQQAKFIKYLEDEIKYNTPNAKWKHYNEDNFNDYDVENSIYIEIKPTNKVLKEVLQKYKEIVNGSERK